MSEKVEKHPSYGAIKVSRVSGTTHLFGSNVEHQHFIEVSIDRAQLHREISHDWLFGNEEIISIWMTELQWATFVSSFNQGSGTPCTIHSLERRRVPEPPFPAKVEHAFKKEVKETAQEAMTALNEAVTRLNTALQPGAKTLNKAELKVMLENLESTARQLTANIPYVLGCFDEAMEKRVTEAKADFESFITRRARELGLEAAALADARANAPALLPEGKDDEADKTSKAR